MAAPAITLRATSPADRDFFFETRRDAFRAYAEQAFGPWDDDKQRASAAKDFDELPIRIIERDRVPIGYQLLLAHDDHWFLDEIALVSAARGAGLGTELVTFIMAAARVAQRPLRLSVLDVNPAQRLYARLGFRITRTEPPRIKMEWP
jgi:ribosomal protein S18 acetylase RimI-like enzyme